jgi:hypothetical protein
MEHAAPIAQVLAYGQMRLGAFGRTLDDPHSEQLVEWREFRDCHVDPVALCGFAS